MTRAELELVAELLERLDRIAQALEASARWLDELAVEDGRMDRIAGELERIGDLLGRIAPPAR